MNFANINDIISLILVMRPSLISITMSILTLFKLLKDFGLVKDKYQKFVYTDFNKIIS